MRTIYVLDTNTIIHYLHNNLTVIQNFEKAVLARSQLLIPRIVDYELRRGFMTKPVPKREAHYNQISTHTFCNIVDMGENFWTRATHVYADLYLKRLTVGEIDIIIGAFCIYNNYTLVTANTKDFQCMDGITLVDWTV
ncbi:MAG: PIN domain-containing protein [Defluviitaleaceae bacterium]|nr:PIN domain-containing protein [Defluviitaleaceae bacterium]